MHEEYELRFRTGKDFMEELAARGFRRKVGMRMADLVFEPKEWKPGDMIAPGYHVIRIRLAQHHRPLIELKEFLHGNTWRELSIRTDDPSAFVRLFSNLMVPRRIIEKQREIWTNGVLEISFDDVKHLGRFIEIEGPQLYVDELALELGFRMDDKEANYGAQLFYLEKTGLIPFHPDEMHAALRDFGF